MSESVGRIDLDLGLNYNQFKRDMTNIAPKAGSLVKGAFGKLGLLAGAAFGAKSLISFSKSAIKAGSDVAEIQNVVDVTFGAMSKEINNFSKELMQNFGVTELAAKKYSSTMGAMLKSTGVSAQATRDMSMDLTRLTADLASFYNMESDEMFSKIMSAMSGMPMPLKQLGINMDVASIEAFALAQGIKKSYNEMSQAEKQILRYNYLMSVTGDMQGDFSRNAHNWGHSLKILSVQWQQLKATIGQGFINVLQPIVTWLNTIIGKIQTAANYFKAFTELVFGNKQAARETAKDLGYIGKSADNMSGGIGDAGKATKKAAKDLKGSLSPFDELSVLMDKTSNAADDATSGLNDIASENIDFGKISPEDVNIEMDINIDKVKDKIEWLKEKSVEIYESWGPRGISIGIQEGLDSINFGSISDNFTSALSGLGEISQAALVNLQPIFQAGGELLGTVFKYGIAFAGNIFEPIMEGFANFVENMKGLIIEWIEETSQTITNGINNLKDVFEKLGEMWLESIEKFKDKIAELVEALFTNIVNTIMLFGTIISDAFEIITGSLSEFVEENKEEIQQFMDSVLQIFTDIWGLINTVWSDALNIIKKFWEEWGKDILKGFMDFVQDIGEWALYLWNDLIKPTWDTMFKWISKIWNETLKNIIDEVVGFVGRVGDLIVQLWDKVLQPIIDNLLKTFVPTFRNAFSLILDIIGSTVDGIAKVIEGLLKMLNGIIDFVVGVFTGDWERAWKGVVGIFSGIIKGLEGVFKAPLNAIISGMNSFIRGANEIQIPDWVPGVGGRGLNIREIPHLAKGAIIDQPTLAMVGEAGKEVVMPLENNTSWIKDLAMQIASQLPQGGTNEGTMNFDKPVEIVIKLGENDFARFVIDSINELFRQEGKILLDL